MISAPDLLGPLVGCGDSFVLIQNGVGVERELQCKLPTTPIISGCAWILATTVDKGRSLKQFGPVGIVFRPLFTPVHLTPGTPYPGSLSSP